MSPRGIQKAIVIGAGIGGLAAALALAQRGVAVRVIEQAPEIAEVGAGLQISPNGLAVLRALGLAEELVARGAVKAQAVVLADYKAGREVARLDLRRLADQSYFFVHRHDLIDLLAEAVFAAGVTVDFGKPVREVLPGTPPRAVLANGDAISAEVILCADGLHSVGRQAVAPGGQAFFTGQVAWRATVPADGSDPAEARVTMGPGRHIVSYPLRQGRLMNLVAVQERAEWAAEGWRHPADPSDLRRVFADFGGPAGRLLEQVRAARVWGLFRHPVAPCWLRENVALLGDAAHPTLPFLAQGANLALEDAWVLSSCLMRGELDTYQDIRRDRAIRVIETASGNAWKYHLRDGPIRRLAHLGLSLGSRVAPGAMMRQFDWLYGHDVTKSSQS
ncbi:FAD-dependent monooxygenase [uncultured Roseobacter sp.]|uniref:FAD-dependent oxidoreductase n=1 Tax=uncultured Roseobacter sp. TaxID=114847 RepID=UPI00260B032B|nr:FAD-dependent monooxygenase [uncultured Roseobacter sp.]